MSKYLNYLPPPTPITTILFTPGFKILILIIYLQRLEVWDANTPLLWPLMKPISEKIG